MILYLITSCCLAILGYLGYLHYQKRLLARPHHVSIQFKRPPGIPSASKQARSPIDNTVRLHNEMQQITPNGGQYIRNRNLSRSSGINYVSPNSMYGYMPKSNILGDRSKTKELKKEFTIKLSPFPQLGRSLKSSNLINSPTSANNSPANYSLLNGSIPQGTGSERPSLTNTSLPRVSAKRPIASNDSGEGDVFLKKTKNLLDAIDLDDSEMFDDSLQDGNIASKKSLKRSTLVFENEAQLNSPLKRVKNNEILSSYSSTSVAQSRGLLNKRKYQHSPDETTGNTRTKKRTYIEELELLTSDNSPYIRNIYHPPPKSPPVIEIDDNESDESGTEDTESQDIEIIEPGEPIEEEPEQSDLFSLIPTHVFSVKEHEYDKKKSKNRLNRYLAAVREGCEINNVSEQQGTNNLSEVVASNDVVDLVAPQASTAISTSTFSFGATNAAPITANASIVPKLTTTIVPSMDKNELKEIDTPFTLPTSIIPATSEAPASKESFTFGASTIASAATFKLPTASSTTAPATFAFGTNSAPSLSLPVNSSSATAALSPIVPTEPSNITSTIPPSSTSFAFGSNPSSNTAPAFTLPVKSPEMDVKLNFPKVAITAVSTNAVFSAPSVASTPSFTVTPLSIPSFTSPSNNVVISSNASLLPLLPTFTSATFASATNQPQSTQTAQPTAGMFAFGQASGQIRSTSTQSKPSFDFSQIKPASLNVSASPLASTSTAISSNATSLPLRSFNVPAANNMFATSTVTNNGFKSATESFQMPSLSTATTSASTFSLNVASPPTFSTNMFSSGFNTPAKPTSTAPNLTAPKATENGFNFKPSTTFDFKSTSSLSVPAAPTKGAFNFSATAAPSNNGFNFAASAGKPAPPSNAGFNFSAAAAPSSGGFNFSAAPSSMGSSSGGFNFGGQPTATPAPAPSSGFLFGGAPAAPTTQQSSAGPFSVNASATPFTFGAGAASPPGGSLFQFGK